MAFAAQLSAVFDLGQKSPCVNLGKEHELS